MKKSISKIYLKSSKNNRVLICLCLIMCLTVAEIPAIERLKAAMDLYHVRKYSTAQKKVNTYLEEFSRDELALDIKDVIEKSMCGIHLMKAFSLFSEKMDGMAAGELRKALEIHPGYTKRIEEKYSAYLKIHDKVKSANRMIYDLLNSPEPDEQTVYDVGRRLRRRIAAEMSAAMKVRLDELRGMIEKLKEKKKWDAAVELVMSYLVDNPESLDAKIILTEINRLAAEDFYMQAVDYLERAKVKQGVEMANKCKEYDAEYFSERLEKTVEDAKINIAMKKDDDAKKQLEVISHLDPENPDPSIYMGLFEEPQDTFLEDTLELYKNRSFVEAAVRFDFIQLREPENSKARLYYHLANARKNIVRINLKKVKYHLIKALEISPDEKEAVDIFGRLQDVLEVMSETL
ncbi:MAG: hypothetical protein ABIH89_05595 [Elusimicrobiota bacterium]